ncbi:MAG: hypothetical protein HOL23_04450 [Gammaproteobacteria bacterium]|nr:hypothetical protein [Gammaproteobacteria bacterium]
MTVLIFMLLNPLYALTITVLLSIITNRVNNVLIAVLYVLSFTLFFSNQEFIFHTDLGSYIDMYHRTQSENISSIFGDFLKNPNGREFLWLYYCIAIGVVTGYSTEVFVVTTYMLIFSLSAYLAFLVSESGRHNLALILFSLIFFEMTFLVVGYNLWRIEVSVLLFLIGLIKYFSFQSKYISRVMIYSTAFIHISIIPIIGLFELYVFFIKRNDRQELINTSLFIKFILFVVGAIYVAYFVTDQILTIVLVNPHHLLHPAIEKYTVGGNGFFDTNISFSFLNYMKPFYAMIIAYLVFNWKNIQHFDLFILATFIIIEVLIYTSNDIPIIYARASIVPKIGLVFIAVKILKRFNYIYIIAFVCTIFTLRILLLSSNSTNLLVWENIAKGDIFNPIYGLIFSIFYFFNPLLYGPMVWFVDFSKMY